MEDARGGNDRSLRQRFEVPLLLIPFLAGIGTAIPLWGDDAPPIFFSTAAEVIALGAVAMALEGGYFRVRSPGRAGLAPVTRATILLSVGVGLGFAFGALVRGEPGPPHTAMTAGALAMGISAFAVQAFFGDPQQPGDQRASG